MTPTQEKNIAWVLPRPKPDHYKGGMPLHAEKWLLKLAMKLTKSSGAKILNLFCGMNKMGLRVDIKKEVNPDICCDVHKLTNYIQPTEFYDIILADPPYSNKEAKELYGTPKLNYKIWTQECDKVLKPGGILIVYHKYIMPNPNPEKYKIVKRVFIGTRTYHVPRVAIFFRKKISQTKRVTPIACDSPDYVTLPES